MKFGALRDRILFMKPTGETTNDMGEKTPAFEVYRPGLPQLFIEEFYEDINPQWRVIKSGNKVILKNKAGQPFELTLSDSEYAYRANVTPTTGREYVEMQKIRAETTYSVQMRYIPNITPDMYILFEGKKLKIESILNIGERNKELQLICVEVIPSGAK